MCAIFGLLVFGAIFAKKTNQGSKLSTKLLSEPQIIS